MNNDTELLMLIKENDDLATKELFNKYKYLVDFYINKYFYTLKKLKIETAEIESEALLAYNDAINNYDESKNASFKTFFSVCFNRRILKIIRKNSSKKMLALNEAYSLDYKYKDSDFSLKDIIEDKKAIDPLDSTINLEHISETNKIIKKILSYQEYEVYSYLIEEINYIDIANILNKTPKQIDNTIQRLRKKIKEKTDLYKG